MLFEKKWIGIPNGKFQFLNEPLPYKDLSVLIYNLLKFYALLIIKWFSSSAT